MPRFYVEGCQDAQTGITIMGEDVNHIKNVLRLTIGDTITVCDGAGKEYECEIAEISKEQVYANIVDINQNAAELPCNITLFQGMPKSDKMEFIIQKAVELGAAGIVPVMMKRTVVKLEDKKKDKKRERYQMIAESAAKQSGRGIIPEVTGFMSFREALQYAGKFDLLIVPYESADGIAYLLIIGQICYSIKSLFFICYRYATALLPSIYICYRIDKSFATCLPIIILTNLFRFTTSSKRKSQ